jgi:hypothetical protein
MEYGWFEEFPDGCIRVLLLTFDHVSDFFHLLLDIGMFLIIAAMK